MTEEVHTINIQEGGQWKTIIPHMAEAAVKDGIGQTITLTYATKAELQSVSADIQHLEIETRDLYDRDSGNIKSHYDHEQTMEGSLVIEKGIRAYPYGWHAAFKSGMAQGHYALFAKIVGGNIGQYHYIELVENSNTASAHAMLVIHDTTSLDGCCFSQMSSHGGNNPLTTGSIVVASDGRDIFLFWKKQAPYGSLGARTYLIINYGSVLEPDHNITWYDDNAQEYNNLDSFQTVVTPVLTVPNVPAGAPSDAVVNKWYVENTDGVTNNLVHRSATETILGVKHMDGNAHKMALFNKLTGESGDWFKVCYGQRTTAGRFAVVRITEANTYRSAVVMFGGFGTGAALYCGLIAPSKMSNVNIIATVDSNNQMALWVKANLTNTPLIVTVEQEFYSLKNANAYEPWVTMGKVTDLAQGQPSSSGYSQYKVCEVY